MIQKIKKFLYILPIPFCGVILSIIALGNLLWNYSHDLHIVCGAIGIIGILLFSVKFLIFPEQIQEALLEKPRQASVLPTYSMSLMSLSAYMTPLMGSRMIVLWWIAIAIHLGLVIWFTVHFLFHLDWEKVFSTYFIGYAGIANIGITAPVFHMERVGYISFWCAIVVVVVVIILVTHRHIHYETTRDEDRPLVCVYASPISVCLAAYVHSASHISYEMLLWLFSLATVFYLIALSQVLRFLRNTFYPSFSAFTFPFVIGAFAAQQTLFCLKDMDRWIPDLNVLVAAETIIAILLVFYTVIRFTIYLREQYKNCEMKV